MNIRKLWITFGGHFDISKKDARLKEIQDMEAMAGFWENNQAASKIQKEKSSIESIIKSFSSLRECFEEVEILVEYGQSGDEESANEAVDLFSQLEEKLSNEEQKAYLSGEVDLNNAIVSINAGAGGTESCDWASMLHRMFDRWCDKSKFSVKVLDHQSGDSAGIKSVTFIVEGPFAFGMLKSEIGVHRLVRISPFDSNARRHTSFASVFVSPELDDDIEIEVPDNEMRIDVYRSGGAGGQSVNTTDSAVRITHLPTGLVVTCQNERSQHQNKATALKVLKSRLYERAMEERRKEQQLVEDSKLEIGWGAQIRSYVLHPYKMVKDHRTGHESGNAEKVLDGSLDDFIKAYLQWDALRATGAQ